jgi:hypothetical protein
MIIHLVELKAFDFDPQFEQLLQLVQRQKALQDYLYLPYFGHMKDNLTQYYYL